MSNDNCTIECERMPECTVCGRRKLPMGRLAHLEIANGYCDGDCPGYYKKPTPGHLWPGELVSMQEADDE